VSTLVNGSPEALEAWNQFYGGGQGGAIAAILDPKTAAPLVDQQVAAAQIGGAALQAGLSANIGTATQAAKNGTTLAQARQAYQAIAARVNSGTDAAISSRFANAGTGTLDQSTEEQATLLGDADAQRKQQLLYNEEEAQFNGHASQSTASNDAGANY